MKKVFRNTIVIALLASLFLVTSCTSKKKLLDDSGKVNGGPSVPVVSYIRTWPLGSDSEAIEKGINWTANDVKAELLSTLNIAFGLLHGNDIYVTEFNGEDPKSKTFPALFDEVKKLKAKYLHLKINLSIGGWGAEGFSDMASTKKNRTEFIGNVSNWIKKYNLDGIDIDWEYSVGPSWGQEIKSRREDADNYLSLLTEMREAFDVLGKKLGRHLSVTTAVPASAWFPQTIDIVAVQEQTDYLKVMTYDYYGGWSATTGHLSNLYNNPNDPEWGGWSTDQTVEMYLEAGVRPEKLLLGVPFYGRAWGGVGDTDNGLYQSYSYAAYPDGLSEVDIRNIFLAKDSGYTRYWDDIAKVPYLYNGDIWITYEDAESLSYKVDYIKEKGLAGIMIWEYGHDVEAKLLKTMVDAIEN